MSNPSPHHRHQASLVGVIDFSASEQILSPQERAQATRIFHTIIETCEPSQNDKGPYKQITLVRLTFEHALSEASRDCFLRYFFEYTEIPMQLSQWDKVSSHDHGPQLIKFADLLVQNFFLPLKASTKKTPQPSPTKLSETQSAQSPAGVTTRLATLRRECLTRDHHRCVISRRFDDQEAVKRVSREGDENAQDDDGDFLKDEAGTFAPLEVAHIIPHSLMTLQAGMSELDESKKTALAILNMFDQDVVHLIEGSNIDRPGNAITLTPEFHQLFGGFEVYFEPIDDLPYTYVIESTRRGILRNKIFPVQRTLLLTKTKTIDPPSPRLLAVHRAITLILSMSTAGRYIDKILENLDQKEVMADGSTELGHFTRLRIQGPWNGQISAF